MEVVLFCFPEIHGAPCTGIGGVVAVAKTVDKTLIAPF